MNFQLELAKITYIIVRVSLRVLGKKKRNDFLNKRHITITSFFISKEIIVTKNGNKSFVRRGYDDYFLWILDREPSLSPYFNINKDEIFIDVGANIGNYTIDMSKKNPKNKIISIEAHPSTYNILKRNIKLNNLKNIVLINKAVYSEKKSLTLAVKNGWSMLSSLMTEIRSDFNNLITVETETLDNLISHINGKVGLMKVDIEGAELHCLYGSKNTLQRCNKIIIEIHDKDLIPEISNILSINGFEIKFLNNKEFVVGIRTKE